MQQDSFGSPRQWVLILSFCVFVAAGATILWAVGYEFFWSVPFVVAGVVLGSCLGYILIRIFGRRRRAFIVLFFAWILVALMYLVLPYEWMFADSNFTEESDNTWIYWLLQGTFFGFVGAAVMLASSLRQENATPGEIRKRRQDGRRSLLILGGTVGGVFALFFLVYVFLEYLLAPIVRFFN